jgi:hypothetical protein
LQEIYIDNFDKVYYTEASHTKPLGSGLIYDSNGELHTTQFDGLFNELFISELDVCWIFYTKEGYEDKEKYPAVFE